MKLSVTKREKLDYLKILARVSHYLESGKPFTADQIGAAIGEGPRTVHRYLKELRTLGFATEQDYSTGRLKLRGAGKARIEKVIAGLLRACRREAQDAAGRDGSLGKIL